MKSLILTLLCSGFTKTKKDISELTAYCYFIERIAEYDKYTKMIRCNSNKFWNCENNENRNKLIKDINSSKRGIDGMFNIYNEYENGDAYGIAK